MSNLTTFERVQAPAVEAPEPHTPGPFIRHGVMVRDTVETCGGMFCVRQLRTVRNNAGNLMPAVGDVLGYAYSRADGDLFAAAPAMLAALRALVAECRAHLDYEDDDDMEAAADAAEAAIAAAEGRP